MTTRYTYLPFLLFLFLSLSTRAQLNMILQDSMDYPVGVNDVCGWVAADGKEYALVGINTGVSIVDINDSIIHEVVKVEGVDNLWRDINTYGHYAYVSSEARVGLLIIDLQYLPDSVQTWVWKDSLPTDNGPKAFEKAHTLWTDEDGRLYLNGSNLNNGGVIVCDLTQDPTDPVFLGYAPAIYSHDCYSRDSMIYSSEIYAGNLSIYDAHDPANITMVGQVHTPYEFTHNAWLSDDGNYMYTTDERGNSFVASYDISDPSNIIELDRYRQAATDGLGNVPHNVYVYNDFIIVAYYANGTIILDAARPDNLVEVGNFDSFLGPDGGFPGVWGAYPYLPSQKILASDRNNGLFVFEPNYVRACYLEGFVVDSVSGEPVNNAEVTILTDEILYPQSTKPDGSFKMGKAIPGQYVVKVTKHGYFDKYITMDFVNGELLTPQILLEPFPTYGVNGKVVYDDTEDDVPFAQVIIFGPLGIYETTCDASGNFLVPAIFGGGYKIQAGIWGFTHESTVVVNQPINLTLNLKKGYKDDFDLDLGWELSGQVENGSWVREVPESQLLFDSWQCGSEGDSPFDDGIFAASTGTSSMSEDVEDSEVSGGITYLTSPAMNLTNVLNPRVAFDYWVCEFPPNQFDGVFVFVTNGVDTIMLDQLRSDSIYGIWQQKEYSIETLNAPLDEVRFMISARDTTTEGNIYILKAHLDNFKLIEGGVSTEEPQHVTQTLGIYPNPLAGNTLYFSDATLPEGNVDIVIADLQGRICMQQSFTHNVLQAGIKVNLPSGLYIVQVIGENGNASMGKLAVITQ